MAPQSEPQFQVNLNGCHALVTGGGGGIGRAIAHALAAAGASVWVGDVNPDRAEAVAEELRADYGVQAGGWHADVANRFQMSGMIEAAREAMGRIHILVNAAGVYKAGAMSGLDEWDWRRIIDVNLTGTFFACQLVGRVMADEGGGVIVNLASTSGHPHPIGDAVSYTTSKAAVIALTKQCAREFATSGIRVNAVCPGNIDEGFETVGSAENPQGRLGTPEEVAQAVLFLCSDAASFITGQALHVDGGSSMM